VTGGERHARWGSAALHAAFFGSGFAALLYEVVWERLLSLFSGSGVVSATLVVAAFLAGLGLGSLAGGAWADRLSARQAVATFAAANAGIAAFAVGSPFLFYEGIFGSLSSYSDSPAAVFTVSFLGLLLPTALMGVSLPCLSRAVTAGREAAAARVSRLYAADLAGAAAGTFVTGWWLQGTFGFVGTIRIGAVVSLLTAGLALAARPGFPAERPARAGALTPAADAATRAWAALVLVSGFLAMSLEIVWFRYFGVVLQSSAYVFAHVLGVFLVFDAFGLWLGARAIARITDRRTAFALLAAAPVLWTTAALWVLGSGRFSALNEWTLEDRTAFSNFIVLGLQPLFVIAPAATLIGMTFPVAQAAVQTDESHVGRRVGLLVLGAIAGNTAGSLVTGLVLLDVLGTPRTLTALAMLAALTGVPPWPSRRAARLRLGAAAVTLAAAAAFPSGARYWPGVKNLVAHGGGDRIFAAEDRTGVSVLRAGGGSGALYIHGRLQGTIPYGRIHCVLGLTGPLLRPDARRILIIGVGSGATPYCAGFRAATERIEAVEIVGSSLDVLRRFSAATGEAATRTLLSDPRYVFVVDDARRYLATRRGRYDVIEADAIPPRSSRSGLLYSAEFFREALEHLEPRGLMVQWRASDRVEATFRSVFPHGLAAGPLLVGSPQPVEWSAPALNAVLEDPATVRWLADAGLKAADLGYAGWGGGEWHRVQAAEDGALNTDLFPRDEFYLNQPAR
jgi:predicted membrane-bound spermidine synthase